MNFTKKIKEIETELKAILNNVEIYPNFGQCFYKKEFQRAISSAIYLSETEDISISILHDNFLSVENEILVTLNKLLA